MESFTIRQIRNFRLRSHHLDREYQKDDALSLTGACGFQNSPPGAWEAALFHRIPSLTLEDADRLLYDEKSLLQAWSFRGAPVVFPTAGRDIFLSALVPADDESWIYTDGIGLALDFLQMDFHQVLKLLLQVIPRLDSMVLESKSALDQTLAQWICPLLPPEKQPLWNHPSMYGDPGRQTVGGAAVSFLLRPCSFLGLVVFGRRSGIYPTFTSLKNWTGTVSGPQGDLLQTRSPQLLSAASSHNGSGSVHPEAPLLSPDPPKEAVRELVRKYLHCYGPSTPSYMAAWLGCTPRQARRMWNTAADQLESANVLGKKVFFLSDDRKALENAAPPERDLILTNAHDPFLDQRDRRILQPEKSFHRRIWRTAANPGAILYQGEIIGIWNSRQQKNGLEFTMEWWNLPEQAGETETSLKRKLSGQAEAYAAFRKQKVASFRCFSP